MAQRDIVLNGAVERVWALITDIRSFPRWLDGVTRVQTISTTNTASGTRFEIVRAGQHGPPETWIVADWEPPRHVRYTEYRHNIQLEYWLQSRGTTTFVRATLDSGVVRGVLGRVLPDRDAATLARSLVRLHEIIASGGDIRGA